MSAATVTKLPVSTGPIRVEKGVPLPVSPGRKPSGPIYPFHQMEVGDSFFVAGKKVSQLTSNVSAQHRSTKRLYSCRTVDGGVRVWRTA